MTINHIDLAKDCSQSDIDEGVSFLLSLIPKDARPVKIPLPPGANDYSTGIGAWYIGEVRALTAFDCIRNVMCTRLAVAYES